MYRKDTIPYQRKELSAGNDRQGSSYHALSARYVSPVSQVITSGDKTRVTISSTNDASSKRPTKTPVYPKVYKEYLSLETLAYYDLPWTYDEDDPNYIIILKDLDSRETTILFEHTARLRNSKLNLKRRTKRRKDHRRSRQDSRSEPKGSDVEDDLSPSHSLRGLLDPEVRKEEQNRGRASEGFVEDHSVKSERGASLSLLPSDHSRSSSRGSSPDLLLEGDNESIYDFDFSLFTFDMPSNEEEISAEYVAIDSADRSLTAGPYTMLEIAYSRWLGDPFDNWDLSAELFIAAPPPQKPSHSVVKWYHLERPLMNFDEMMSVTRKALRVAEGERRHIEDLLRTTRKEHEKQRQHGRDMEPICVSEVDYQDDDVAREKQPASVCFMSFPHFVLDKFWSKQLSAGSIEHPIRPLVQSHTRTSNKERELSQAITTMTTTPKGNCLHVATVWCLLVNEDLMITCSKASQQELQREVLSTTSETVNGHHVYVKAGETRQWRLPRQRVTTLPALASLFAESISDVIGLGSNAEFRHKGRPFGLQQWEQTGMPVVQSDMLLRLECNSRSKSRASKTRALREARDFFVSREPADSTSPRETTGDSPQARKPLDVADIKALKIFQYSGDRSARSLDAAAQRLHRVFSEHESRSVREQYSSCPEASRTEVQSWIDTSKLETARDRRKSSRKPGASLTYQKVVIAVLAEYIFCFFWPIEYDHIFVRKFWGALKKLLTGNSSYVEDVFHSQEFINALYDDVFAFTASFGDIFSQNPESLPDVPANFHRAWLHLHSAFILAVQTDFKEADSYHAWGAPVTQLENAGKELRAGERTLTLHLRKGQSLDDFEVCSSRGIAALIMDRCSRDIMQGLPDVAQTYSDYCQQLEAKIMAKPLDRSHQESLRALHQELEAVSSTLNSQLNVITAFDVGIQKLDGITPIPTLPALRTSRLETVLKRCEARISAKIDQFEAHQSRLTELGEWHLGEIDTNKDRQEAAIMVFTIVTIIFLPLSFVASVLGMNTADIRDMGQGQWVFWASAIPLTIVVMVGSLWWAGALDDLKTWLANSTKHPASYRPMKEDVNVMRLASRVPEKSYGFSEKMPVSGPRKRTTYPIKHG